MGEMALVEALALVMALVGAGEMMATEALALVGEALALVGAGEMMATEALAAVAETWGEGLMATESQCLPTLPTSPLR